MIKKFNGISPEIDESAFIAETAVVIGKVKINSDSNIWFNAVLRGDVNGIVIGKNTNIQDLTMVHVDRDFPTTIGDNVTIGHSAIIHGSTIGNNCLIGMGAIILDGAIIKENVIIGAGALIPQGKTIEKNSLVLGSPGKIIRELTDEEIEMLKESTLRYVELSKKY